MEVPMPFATSKQLYDDLIAPIADPCAGSSPTLASGPVRQTAAPHEIRPGVAASPAALDELLLLRRACRDFLDQPLEVATLTAVASTALETATVMWGHRMQADFGVSLVACAYNVSGLNKGACLFHPQLAEPWQPISPEAGWPNGRLEGLRESYAKAPVLILAYVGLECACSRPRGYATALMMAAATTYTAWLASVAHGLHGCMFGRADPSVATLTLPGSAGSLRQLATLAIGYGRNAQRLRLR
jgi:hypothetical protein